VKSYLWEFEYDVINAMRFTRKKYVVTQTPKPSVVETIFMKGLGSGEKEAFDFIRKIEFEREVIQ